MPRAPEAKHWWSRLAHEQVFWQVVFIVVLLIILVIVGPLLGIHFTSSTLP